MARARDPNKLAANAAEILKARRQAAEAEASRAGNGKGTATGGSGGPTRDSGALRSEGAETTGGGTAGQQRPAVTGGESQETATPKSKKLEGSDGVEGGGADEESADDEKSSRRRRDEHEMKMKELEQQRRHAIEMMRLREREAIRRENREEARRYGPLSFGTVTMKTVGGKLVTTDTWNSVPNPFAGSGVYFDPGDGGPSFGGSSFGGPTGGVDVTDNTNGKRIVGWTKQNSYPPQYIPEYADGSKGRPISAADFGDDKNPLGTGRLGIPALSTEARDSFIKRNLGGASEGDANYKTSLARAESMWDSYRRDTIKAFQGVGAALAEDAKRSGIGRRVIEASRDPFVVGMARDASNGAIGGDIGSQYGQPGRIGGDIMSQYGQPGRIGIGPRDSKGRSALSPSWGGGRY